MSREDITRVPDMRTHFWTANWAYVIIGGKKPLRLLRKQKLGGASENRK